jgi:hypothetical protein
MASWVDKWPRWTVDVGVISFSLTELAGLNEVGGIVDWMERAMMEKVEVENKFDGEEDGGPVFKIKLPCEGYEGWSTRSRGRVILASRQGL